MHWKDAIARNVLCKRAIRSDAIWTHALVFRTPLRYIPFVLDTWALLRSQYWSRESIESFQDERLRSTLVDSRRIAYWSGLLSDFRIRDTEKPRDALQRLPITSKKELRERSLPEIHDVNLVYKSDPDNTSGSTGKPFHFRQDWYASLRSYAVTERIFRSFGQKRSPVVYMRSRERNGFTFYKHYWFFVRGFNAIKFRMQALSEFVQQFRQGFVLYGYTSWIVEVAHTILSLGIKLPLNAVFVAGEHLLPADKAFVEKVTGAPVFSFYASREVGFLAFECEKRQMHINEEWAYIEIVDEKGQRLRNGCEGRIIVTTFDNRIMPFIRYDLGDIGAISESACPCGRNLRTLHFRGRIAERIELADGRVVSLLDLSYGIGTFRDSILQYQILQSAPMKFKIKIVEGPGFKVRKTEIERLIRMLLHPEVELCWEKVDSIPEASSGKAEYFKREYEKAD